MTLLLWVGMAYAQPVAPTASKNLIILIGDGMGPSQVTLTRLFASKFLEQDRLAMDKIYVGANTTYADPDRTAGLSGAVADSAAAATAIATGKKTYNRAIAISNESIAHPYATVLEAAKDQGQSIGIITTTSVSHATPAAFLAHVRDRDMEAAIVAQYLDTDADVIMGGGESFFVSRAEDSYFGLANRTDGQNYLDLFRAKDYTIVNTRQALQASQADKLLGLFAPVHIPYVLDRDQTIPTLSEQLTKALTVLEANPNGFVVMLEGGRIDHAAHLNDPSSVVHETLEFDEAVSLALDYAGKHPDTSVIVTADHETGGLSVGRDGVYDINLDVLNRVNISSEALALLITHAQSNQKIVDIIKNQAGITDLSDEEFATIIKHKPTLPLAATASFSISLQSEEVLDLAVALNHIISKRAWVGWTSEGHTGEDVGVYAYGPASRLLVGLTDDTYLAQATTITLGLDLESINDVLQSKYLYPDHWVEVDGKQLFPLAKIAEALTREVAISGNTVTIDGQSFNLHPLNTQTHEGEIYIQLEDLSRVLAIPLVWDGLSERIIVAEPASDATPGE